MPAAVRCNAESSLVWARYICIGSACCLAKHERRAGKTCSWQNMLPSKTFAAHAPGVACGFVKTYLQPCSSRLFPGAARHNREHLIAAVCNPYGEDCSPAKGVMQSYAMHCMCMSSKLACRYQQAIWQGSARCAVES